MHKIQHPAKKSVLRGALKRHAPIALIVTGAIVILVFAWRLPLPEPKSHYSISIIVPYYSKDTLVRQKSIRSIASRLDYDIKIVPYFNSFNLEAINACEAMDDLVVVIASRNNGKTMESFVRTFPGAHISLISATRKIELIADSVVNAVSKLDGGSLAPGVDYP